MKNIYYYYTEKDFLVENERVRIFWLNLLEF